MTQFTTRQGLPSDKIHFITEDGQGQLWMSGPSGILSHLARRAGGAGPRTLAAAGGPLYTTAEGLSTNQMNGGVQPAGLLAATGELWFPSTKGVGPHRCRTFPSASGPPPVLIEQVLADDRPVAFDEPLLLAAGRRASSRSTTRRSACDPRSGSASSTGWRASTATGPLRASDASPTTPTCPPGDYRFHVAAYELNAPAERHGTGRCTSTWRPHFYQTAWFLALCAVVVAAVAWGSYRLHVRNIRRRFAAVLEERNRLAREMHDTLIQGCVGVSTLLEAASHAQDVSPQLSRELLDRARSEVRGDRRRGTHGDLGPAPRRRRTAINGSAPSRSSPHTPGTRAGFRSTSRARAPHSLSMRRWSGAW